MKQTFLARRRVALGFVFGAFVVYFAAPQPMTIALGAAVAVIGQAVRIWAAGHLEKSREVTVSGPYRFMRHPLYVGSSIMAIGVVIACQSLVVAVLVALYMSLTISSAISSEEAFLRERFGNAYDDYAASRGPRVERRFSWARAWRNKEYRAATGLVLFLLAMTVRMYVGRWHESGSGGIGAVSVGCAELAVNLLAVLVVAGLGWWLGGRKPGASGGK